MNAAAAHKWRPARVLFSSRLRKMSITLPPPCSFQLPSSARRRTDSIPPRRRRRAPCCFPRSSAATSAPMSPSFVSSSSREAPGEAGKIVVLPAPPRIQKYVHHLLRRASRPSRDHAQHYEARISSTSTGAPLTKNRRLWRSNRRSAAHSVRLAHPNRVSELGLGVIVITPAHDANSTRRGSR